MKKYVKAIIAACLAFVSLIAMGFTPDAKVKVGAGYGKNAEVESMEEMYAVLDFISDRNNSDKNTSASVDGGVALAAFGTSSVSEEHTSVTMIEESVVSVKATQRQMTGYDSYTNEPTYTILGTRETKMTRSLTVYITEDASFYVSKGVISSSDSPNGYSDKDSSSFFSFNLQIYLGENEAMVKFDEYTKTSKDYVDGEQKATGFIMKPSAKGKWIKIPDAEAEDVLAAVDQMNRYSMGLFKSYIEKSFNDEAYKFDEKNNKYELDNTFGDLEAKVVCDFSDSTAPYIELVEEEEDEYSSSYIYAGMKFCNIDNTVIKVNIEPDFENEDVNDLFVELK